MKATYQNPVQAIRARCVDCCGGDRNEVQLCPSEDCPLHPFRMGKNPFRAKREYTQAQKRALLERMAKA